MWRDCGCCCRQRCRVSAVSVDSGTGPSAPTRRPPPVAVEGASRGAGGGGGGAIASSPTSHAATQLGDATAQLGDLAPEVRDLAPELAADGSHRLARSRSRTHLRCGRRESLTRRRPAVRPFDQDARSGAVGRVGRVRLLLMRLVLKGPIRFVTCAIAVLVGIVLSLATVDLGRGRGRRCVRLRTSIVASTALGSAHR